MVTCNQMIEKFFLAFIPVFVAIDPIDLNSNLDRKGFGRQKAPEKKG